MDIHGLTPSYATHFLTKWWIYYLIFRSIKKSITALICNFVHTSSTNQWPWRTPFSLHRSMPGPRFSNRTKLFVPDTTLPNHLQRSYARLLLLLTDRYWNRGRIAFVAINQQSNPDLHQSVQYLTNVTIRQFYLCTLVPHHHYHHSLAALSCVVKIGPQASSSSARPSVPRDVRMFQCTKTKKNFYHFPPLRQEAVRNWNWYISANRQTHTHGKHWLHHVRVMDVLLMLLLMPCQSHSLHCCSRRMAS